MSGEAPVIVFTTTAPEDAPRIAEALVSAHVAACVNMHPVRSMYWWNDALQNDEETLLIVKTTRGALAALKEKLLAIHPYEVPEFLAIETSDVSAAYGKWLVDSTSMPVRAK